MVLKAEERVRRWVLKKTVGHTFTASDLSKDTGLPGRGASKLLGELEEKENQEGMKKTLKRINPEKKGVQYVWERI